MRELIFLISIFLIPGAVKVFKDGLLLMTDAAFYWQWLISGFLLGSLLYYFVRHRSYPWELFEHELTHAFVALLFFRRITRFVVTRREGGYVQHSGGFGGELGDHLIGLAPYFMPTFSFILGFVYPFTPLTWRKWILLAIGLTFAYHTFSTIRETIENWHTRSFRQARTGRWVLSDIGRRGYIFSGILIFTFTLLCHSIIFWLVRYGYSAIPIWLNILWKTGLVFYVALFHKLIVFVKFLLYKLQF